MKEKKFHISPLIIVSLLIFAFEVLFTLLRCNPYFGTNSYLKKIVWFPCLFGISALGTFLIEYYLKDNKKIRDILALILTLFEAMVFIFSVSARISQYGNTIDLIPLILIGLEALLVAFGAFGRLTRFFDPEKAEPLFLDYDFQMNLILGLVFILMVSLMQVQEYLVLSHKFDFNVGLAYFGLFYSILFIVAVIVLTALKMKANILYYAEIISVAIYAFGLMMVISSYAFGGNQTYAALSYGLAHWLSGAVIFILIIVYHYCLYLRGKTPKKEKGVEGNA